MSAVCNDTLHMSLPKKKESINQKRKKRVMVELVQILLPLSQSNVYQRKKRLMVELEQILLPLSQFNVILSEGYDIISITLKLSPIFFFFDKQNLHLINSLLCN